MEYGIIILIIIGIIGISVVEWRLGKWIGQHLSNDVAIVLGIVLILCGAGIFIGIPCIVYRGALKERRFE